MATSVRWPMERTASGGAARTETAEECLRQVIVLSCIPGKSANPWHLRAGLGMPDDTYSPGSSSLGPDEQEFLKRRFSSLERGERARLLRTPEVEGRAGGRTIRVAYFNLESQAGDTAETR